MLTNKKRSWRILLTTQFQHCNLLFLIMQQPPYSCPTHARMGFCVVTVFLLLFSHTLKQLVTLSVVLLLLLLYREMPEETQSGFFPWFLIIQGGQSIFACLVLRHCFFKQTWSIWPFWWSKAPQRWWGNFHLEEFYWGKKKMIKQMIYEWQQHGGLNLFKRKKGRGGGDQINLTDREGLVCQIAHRYSER